jgi:hypothetical protein
MKPVVLSLHARYVAQQRGIQNAWIEATALQPDWVAPDPSGAERRFRAIVERDHRILRIVCTETDTEVRVITAFLDRNARRPQ